VLQAFEAQRVAYLESENAELQRQVEAAADQMAEAAREQYRCAALGTCAAMGLLEAAWQLLSIPGVPLCRSRNVF
jgi:hypothetical protein